MGIIACAAVQSAVPRVLNLSNRLPLLPIAVGSLLPDVDCPTSTAGKAIPGSRLGRVGRVVVGALLLALGLLACSESAATLSRQGTARPALVICAVAVGIVLTGLLDHRGFTHSLLGIAAAVGLAEYFLPARWQCVGFCYGLHILADALTPAGVPLLWPLNKRFGFGLVRTGSTGYGLLSFAVWIMAIAAVLKKGVAFV
jgi:membrane-bound metal-dependent hydrolase YbcI (DUF457 family)